MTAYSTRRARGCTQQLQRVRTASHDDFAEWLMMSVNLRLGLVAQDCFACAASNSDRSFREHFKLVAMLHSTLGRLEIGRHYHDMCKGCCSDVLYVRFSVWEHPIGKTQQGHTHLTAKKAKDASELHPRLTSHSCSAHVPDAAFSSFV